MRAVQAAVAHAGAARGEFGGRFLLATIDVDANPQLGQAFQIQSIPTVFAVLKGQPIPLFQGAQPEAQIRAVLTELLRVAAANGVTGTVDVPRRALRTRKRISTRPRSRCRRCTRRRTTRSRKATMRRR